MQVSKSIGILLAAAGSLGHVAASQAQELSIRPLPIAPAAQPAPTETLALAVPVAETANQLKTEALALAVPATANPPKTEALAVPAAATTAPVAAALPIQQIWTLTAGVTIKENLETWAEKVQWHIVWPETLKTWVVPNETSFTGSFPDAAEKVIKTLAENGALVRAITYEGNKTFVVSGPGLAQQ